MVESIALVTVMCGIATVTTSYLICLSKDRLPMELPLFEFRRFFSIPGRDVLVLCVVCHYAHQPSPSASVTTIHSHNHISGSSLHLEQYGTIGK